jgi:hypothetical protein
MPIKKRRVKTKKQQSWYIALKPTYLENLEAATDTYAEVRAKFWASQNNERVNFHASQRDGKPFEDEVLLHPKRGVSFEDTWHCSNKKQALEVVSILARFPDLMELTWHGQWVKIKYSAIGPWELPGQVSRES